MVEGPKVRKKQKKIPFGVEGKNDLFYDDFGGPFFASFVVRKFLYF